MFAYRTPLTTTGAPAIAQAKVNQSTDFWGLSPTNNETSTVIYLKLWWQGNSNVAPILGTTVLT